MGEQSTPNSEYYALVDTKRKQIREQFTMLLTKLDEVQSTGKLTVSTTRAEEVQRIADEAKMQIANLAPIPKGLSQESTAELAAARIAAIARIRDNAKREREKVAVESAQKLENLNTGISALKGSVKGSENLNREKIASDIKGSLEQALQNYKVLIEAVKAKYEARYNAEYDAIKQNA